MSFFFCSTDRQKGATNVREQQLSNTLTIKVSALIADRSRIKKKLTRAQGKPLGKFSFSPWGF
jgi:hypothetical protein